MLLIKKGRRIVTDCKKMCKFASDWHRCLPPQAIAISFNGMKSQRSEASNRSIFDEYLVLHGRRRTPERFAILSAVEACPIHFRAEQVIENLEQNNYHVSSPTVYHTLELLIDCGLVRRFVINRNIYEYERTEAPDSIGRPVHLICKSCGRIKLVKDTELARSISVRTWGGFSPEDYSLNIYGQCSACRRRSRANNRNPYNTNKPTNKK